MPRLPPPPQSPEMAPIDGNRTSPPAAETPTQLMPAPHTTATRFAALVPARKSANVSLSSEISDPQPARDTRSRSMATSTGKSAPARYTAACRASVESTLIPASALASAVRLDSTSNAASTPMFWWLEPGPRA